MLVRCGWQTWGGNAGGGVGGGVYGVVVVKRNKIKNKSVKQIKDQQKLYFEKRLEISTTDLTSQQLRVKRITSTNRVNLNH